MAIPKAIESYTLAEVIERILDKGIVIAGDIRINLGDVELLSIELRLLICSVDKAHEIGLDWWVKDGTFSSRALLEEQRQDIQLLREKLERLEGRV